MYPPQSDDFQSHTTSGAERRLASRIDATMRLNYQPISRQLALKDPYDTTFSLPRYFLLVAELDQIDSVQQELRRSLAEKQPEVARLLDLLNQKIDLVSGTFYDTLVNRLPSSVQVNLSEMGLGFHAQEPLAVGTYLHLTLTNPETAFYLAATAQVVYSLPPEPEGHRIGACFITLSPKDRLRLAQAIRSWQHQLEPHTRIRLPDPLLDETDRELDIFQE